MTEDRLTWSDVVWRMGGCSKDELGWTIEGFTVFAMGQENVDSSESAKLSGLSVLEEMRARARREDMPGCGRRRLSDMMSERYEGSKRIEGRVGRVGRRGRTRVDDEFGPEVCRS